LILKNTLSTDKMRWLFLTLLLSFLSSCSREEDSYVGGLGFEQYVEQYNSYISDWLGKQLRETEEQLAKAEVGSSDHNLISEKISMLKGRQELGDYLSFKGPDDLPSDLVWKDGMDEPEQGDPAAKKGGVWRYFTSSFPPTLRLHGSKTNNSFRSNLYHDHAISLVQQNRVSGNVIPGVAKEWAASADKKTYYFRLNEDATYNDGTPVIAKDYLISVQVQTSNNVTAPYYKQYLREEFAQWTVYDDHTLAVTFPGSKPELVMMEKITNMQPSPADFFEEYGPDYEDRYQWRPHPVVSPYYVLPEDIKKGESITLTRRKDYWTEDKKYYQYYYNPDKLVWRIIRDRSKAFELFRAGELDFELISGPKAWYEKTEIDQVFDGYIERHWWYNQFPRPPWGCYLNTLTPVLANRDARIGIAHALNWDKVISVIFWGDFKRLPGFVDGYGDMVRADVQPKPYSAGTARKYFAKVGYTEEGEDGILETPGGKRLEVVVSYATSNPIFGKIVAILKNEGKAAGIDFILNGLDAQVSYKRQMEKKHEIVISAWSVQPPFFSFYEYFHSRNAYDEKGNPKFETNNVFTYANPEMDKLCEAYRAAKSREEKKQVGLIIQKMVDEECLFVPGWKRDFERVACWRWMRWPNSEEVKFCPPIYSYPYESYCFWIDDEMKEETIQAMRDGKTFPEVENIVEKYRSK
jgi:microcin C transport system substrate-binding protein